MRKVIKLFRGTQAELVASSENPRLVVTPNTDHLRLLEGSAAFRRAYACADVVVNDSQVLELLAFRGRATKVSGSDLTPLKLAALPDGARVSIVGCPKKVGDWLETAYPAIQFQLAEPSMGFIRRPNERRRLETSTKDYAPDLILICTGAPQSELLGAQFRRNIGTCDIVCAGSSLIFMAGLKTRAPSIIRGIGLEWLWRMWGEPHTRFRYVIDALFLITNIRQLLQFRLTGAASFRRFKLVSE